MLPRHWQWWWCALVMGDGGEVNGTRVLMAIVLEIVRL